MRKTELEKNWVPLAEGLKNPFVTLKKKQIYNFITNRVLYNGFVVKKGHSNRWEYFCLEDYKKWKNC